MRDRTWAAGAGAAATAAFLPAAGFGFVYDDHRFYSENPNLASPSILWRAFVDPSCQTADATEAGLWRPLRTLSFALDRLLFGTAAWGPHVVNALLHGAATALVFLLLRRFGASALASLLGALLYALHPAQTECVAWISSRGDLLAIGLVLGAILLDLSGRTKTALALGVAALLSKEQAAVWPVLGWIAARLAGKDGVDAFRRAVAPCVAVGACFALRALVGVEGQQGGLGVAANAKQLTAMLGRQTWSALVPVGAVFDWQMPAGELPVAAALVAALALAAAFFRPTSLVALWFLVALAPTLFVQAFVPLNILVADRFLLFALPALAAGAAFLVDGGGAAPAALGVLCFGALTEASLPTWKSEDALWTRTADRVPGHARANHWLGLEAMKRGELDAAVARLRTAAAADPAGAKTRFHLASALEALGRANAKDPAKGAKLLEEAAGEYGTSMALLSQPRTEGRDEILPLAIVASVDLAVLVGEPEALGENAVRGLLEAPRPPVPERVREAWTSRVKSLAASCSVHPKLGPEAAKKVLEWGRLP